jgi:membrane-associated phospholipid phosphatase
VTHRTAAQPLQYLVGSVMQRRWLKRGLCLMVASWLSAESTVARADTPARRLVFDQRYRPFQRADAAQRYASFPSGHVSAALVGAGLSCAHHRYLSLDGGAADTLVCVTATALGVANGIARVSADRHYMTDVLAGAVLGWGAGYAMPVLLHYEWGSAAAERAWTVSPWATSSTLGVAALGLW